MAIEIVDFPIENGGSFHSYVKLPEGTTCGQSSVQGASLITGGIGFRLFLGLFLAIWTSKPAVLTNDVLKKKQDETSIPCTPRFS